MSGQPSVSSHTADHTLSRPPGHPTLVLGAAGKRIHTETLPTLTGPYGHRMGLRTQALKGTCLAKEASLREMCTGKAIPTKLKREQNQSTQHPGFLGGVGGPTGRDTMQGEGYMFCALCCGGYTDVCSCQTLKWVHFNVCKLYLYNVDLKTKQNQTNRNQSVLECWLLQGREGRKKVKF